MREARYRRNAGSMRSPRGPSGLESFKTDFESFMNSLPFLVALPLAILLIILIVLAIGAGSGVLLEACFG